MKEVINFLLKYGITIISIFAALAAWVPFMLERWRVKKRIPSCVVVDYRIMDQGSVSDSNRENKIDGTILVLALNCFVSEKALFAKDYTIEACVRGETKTSGVLFDGEIKESNTNRIMTIPNEYNFNLHREIVQDKDNVRIFPFLLKNVAFSDIKDIDYIKITFKGNKETKTLHIKQSDIPVYNRMGFISKFLK